jgi:hypothetical protein
LAVCIAASACASESCIRTPLPEDDDEEPDGVTEHATTNDVTAKLTPNRRRFMRRASRLREYRSASRRQRPRSATKLDDRRLACRDGADVDVPEVREIVFSF